MIHINIQDGNSRIRFLQATITAEDFASMMTGLSHVPIEVEYNNLANVGKLKVIEKRSAIYLGDSDNRDKMVKWLENNCQEVGWNIDSYLGSQRSVVTDNISGHTTLNYTVHKYVDEQQ